MQTSFRPLRYRWPYDWPCRVPGRYRLVLVAGYDRLGISMRLPMRPDPQPRPLVSRGDSAPSLLSELLQGLAVQRRVIVAIILREVRTRFGQYHLGYLWAVIVPLLFIMTLAFVYAALGRRAAHGASVELLLLSGMMAWLTFTDAQNQASRCIPDQSAACGLSDGVCG